VYVYQFLTSNANFKTHQIQNFTYPEKSSLSLNIPIENRRKFIKKAKNIDMWDELRDF